MCDPQIAINSKIRRLSESSVLIWLHFKTYYLGITVDISLRPLSPTHWNINMATAQIETIKRNQNPKLQENLNQNYRSQRSLTILLYLGGTFLSLAPLTLYTDVCSSIKNSPSASVRQDILPRRDSGRGNLFVPQHKIGPLLEHIDQGSL